MWNSLGQSYEGLDKFEEAIQCYKQSVESDVDTSIPSHAAARLGFLYKNQATQSSNASLYALSAQYYSKSFN